MMTLILCWFIENCIEIAYPTVERMYLTMETKLHYKLTVHANIINLHKISHQCFTLGLSSMNSSIRPSSPDRKGLYGKITENVVQIDILAYE